MSTAMPVRYCKSCGMSSLTAEMSGHFEHCETPTAPEWMEKQAPRRTFEPLEVPRDHATARIMQADVAREVDESLDPIVPEHPQVWSQRAVDRALDPLCDIIPVIHSGEVRKSLAYAYEQGLADAKRLVEVPPEEVHVDPMDGALRRLRGTVHDPMTNRDVSLAVNEAYRNGWRAKERSHVCAEPEQVAVHVPGVPYESEDGNTGSCDWLATPVKNKDEHSKVITFALPDRFWDLAQERALEAHSCTLPEVGSTGWVLIPGLRAPERMEGDPHKKTELWQATNFGPPHGPVQLRVDDPRGTPNDVAVGRFKASLRKFLGVD